MDGTVIDQYKVSNDPDYDPQGDDDDTETLHERFPVSNKMFIDDIIKDMHIWEKQNTGVSHADNQ